MGTTQTGGGVLYLWMKCREFFRATVAVSQYLISHVSPFGLPRKVQHVLRWYVRMLLELAIAVFNVERWRVF